MLAGQWRRLVGATRFLTRLPTPAEVAFAPDGIDRAACYFPLVGQLVALLCGAVWLAAGRLWPGLPAAALAVGAGVLITGALHEDGLADVAVWEGIESTDPQYVLVYLGSRTPLGAPSAALQYDGADES